MIDKIKVTTPELLWHGGGNENGKPDPVYSVDFHPFGVLASAGLDANVPPKGCARLWKINQQEDGQDFIIEFSDHHRSINALKFSPCGKHLATASDRTVIIYSVANANMWEDLTDIKNVDRIWISSNLDEIYDIQWSPDSSYVIAGSINAKAEIIRLNPRDSIVLPGHTSYVQGVAWDPLNQMVVSQSADRSCKIHLLKTIKNTNTIKLAPRGHVYIRTSSINSKNLFADATVPCFFRRPTFTPDGALILCPTGLYRPHSIEGTPLGPQSFGSYIISRNHLNEPLAFLGGLEDPSVAIRCSPILYKLVEGSGETLINGAYRISGCHFAAINDATWSADGNLLVVCSSDGYLSFIRFAPGALGEALADDEIPISVRKALPCLYKYEPPVPVPQPVQILIVENDIKEVDIPVNDDENKTSSAWMDTLLGNSEKKDKSVEELDEKDHVSSPDDSLTSETSILGMKIISSQVDAVIPTIIADHNTKKRRIAPINIAPLGTDVSTLKTMDQNVNNPVHASAPVEVNVSSSDSVVTEQKLKKRIVPTLVTSLDHSIPYTTSHLSSSSSSSNQRDEPAA